MGDFDGSNQEEILPKLFNDDNDSDIDLLNSDNNDDDFFNNLDFDDLYSSSSTPSSSNNDDKSMKQNNNQKKEKQQQSSKYDEITLQKLTVVQLKEQLRDKNLKVS